MQRRTVIWKILARNRRSDNQNQHFMDVSTLVFCLDQEYDLKTNIPIVSIYILVRITEHSWNIWMK